MDDQGPSQLRRRRRRRLPVLTPLVAVVLLVVLATPVPVARLADEKPWCLWDLGVPDEAYEGAADHYATFRYMFRMPDPSSAPLRTGRPFVDRLHVAGLQLRDLTPCPAR